MWAAGMLIGAFGAIVSSSVLHAEPLGVRLLLLTLGSVCALATPGYLWRAIRGDHLARWAPNAEQPSRSGAAPVQ